MNLPVPTTTEVAEFRELYRTEYGIELTDEQAWEAATRTLQLFYLATYGLLHIQPQEPGG